MKLTKQHLLMLSISIALIAIIAIIISFSGPKFNKDNVGKESNISWSYVNVRTEHSTSSEILTSLTAGTPVTLTGNQFDSIGGAGLATESWVEIQLKDGTIGWIVRSAIAW